MSETFRPWGAPTDEVPPGRYRHFKGGLYDVLGLTLLTDGDNEGETAVAYAPRYPVPGPPVAVRSLRSWLTPTPDGQARFTPVD